MFIFVSAQYVSIVILHLFFAYIVESGSQGFSPLQSLRPPVSRHPRSLLH